MRAALIVTAYRVGAGIAARLPERLAEAVIAPIATVVRRLARGRAAMLGRHLRRVLPDASDEEIGAAVGRGFESYVRYYVESFRLPGRDASEIDARFRVVGYEHIEVALAAGRGVVLALPHLGGWEWAGYWLTRVKGLSVSVVVEALDPPELFDFFADFRAELGMEVIVADVEAAAKVAAALARNDVVCLLCDRDVTGSGVEVPFLGEATRLPAGPALLGLRSGTPVLPTAVYFEPDGMHFGLVRPGLDLTRRGRIRDDVRRVTEELAGELGALIAHAPDQWHLLQPNWPSDHPVGPG